VHTLTIEIHKAVKAVVVGETDTGDNAEQLPTSTA